MPSSREHAVNPSPEPGALIGNKYRIVHLLGAGGMGMVFQAEHQLTEKRVALKLLQPQYAARPEHVQRMLREAQASARIRHPNVVDVFDVGSHGDSLFLVMEYLEGETLTAKLARGLLPPQQVLALLLPAMRGVAACHAAGIVHRDVKPDNIFLARVTDRAEPVPKVLDFGISKVPSQSGEDLSLTASGVTLGTPLYMSYEQLSGLRNVDARGDVYAFGVILYEALTGRMPFRADTLGSLAVQVATTTPPRPSELRPELHPGLDDVVMRAIARNRDARFGSLDALLIALAPFAGDDASFVSLDTQPVPRTPQPQPSTAPTETVAPASVSAASSAVVRHRIRLPFVFWASALLILALAYLLFRTGSSTPAGEMTRTRGRAEQAREPARHMTETPPPPRESSEEQASAGAAPPSSESSRTPRESAPTKRKQSTPKPEARDSATPDSKLPQKQPVSAQVPELPPAAPAHPARVTPPPDAPINPINAPLHRAGKPTLDEF